MKKITVFIKTLHEDLVPRYCSFSSSGADIFAAIEEKILLKGGESVLVPSGIYVEIPEGYELQVRPRSGLALHHQITVLNTPGTIDADYRGEIGIILINHGKNPFVIEPKMRIAQLVLSPVCQAEFVPRDELLVTERGKEGFGHSGLF